MKPATLKAIRLTHHYSGVFLAPAILFFAITGGLQTFSLHETTRGSSYKPPALLVHLSQLHKKATLVVPERRPGPPPGAVTPSASAAAPKTAPVAPAEGKTKNLLPMKIFFALVSIGLVLSTVTGVVMAFKYTRSTATVAGVLAAGVVLPLLLLLL